MSVVVVGSIAFDAVKTPFGERERMLGGSAVHFSLAASFFTDVRVVGPVGDDFGEAEYDGAARRGVNTDDIEHVEGGKTFFWAGEYEWNLNVRHTLDTQLNVFGEFQPKLSDASKADDPLPRQHPARPPARGARAVHGREARRARLDEPLDRDRARLAAAHDRRPSTCVLMNDDEVRMLTEEPTLLRAARKIMELGPRVVVAKQGEYGAAALHRGELVLAQPAYPLESVVDPTGAGDAFAGGFRATSTRPRRRNSDDADPAAGDTPAHSPWPHSFWVEEFGCERAQRLTREDIEERYEAFRAMTLWRACRQPDSRVPSRQHAWVLGGLLACGGPGRSRSLC